jgi:hypothetical protein
LQRSTGTGFEILTNASHIADGTIGVATITDRTAVMNTAASTTVILTAGAAGEALRRPETDVGVGVRLGVQAKEDEMRGTP